MKPSEAAAYRAYREGRRAAPGEPNPYRDTSLQEHWARGHHDRWLLGADASDKAARAPLRLLAAKLVIAAGASAIIYSFIRALCAQP